MRTQLQHPTWRYRRGLIALLIGAVLLTACIRRPPAPPARPLPPPGTLGFDACTAPSDTTMSQWLASPYRVVGIYLGGRNRGCGDGNLSASWVSTVAAQGWWFLPIWVGYQAPCTSRTNVTPFDIDPALAVLQGHEEADLAADRSAEFGLGPGNPIYYDMEAYDPTGQACANVVQAFTSGWVDELHARGYLAGFYSSGLSGITDEVNAVVNGRGYHWPDQIWIADWNDQATVRDDVYIPEFFWSNHSRHHQYHGGHPEAWGGVTINIDSNISDGAAARP